jgi:outer membrane protein insertion porin family
MGHSAIARRWTIALGIGLIAAMDGVLAQPINAQSADATGWDEVEVADGILLYPEIASDDAEPILVYPDSSNAPENAAGDPSVDDDPNDALNDAQEDTDQPRLPSPPDNEAIAPADTDDEDIPFYPSVTAPDVSEPGVDEQSDPVPRVTAPSVPEPRVSAPSGTESNANSPNPRPDDVMETELFPSVEILVYPDVSDPATESPELLQDASNAPIATDVEIQGGDTELQQIIRDVISVQVGRPADANVLEGDRLAIEGTGLVESVEILTTPQADGVVVTYAIEPIVVRSLDVTGAQVLPPEVVEDAFAAQLDQPISPRLLNQGADDVDAWYLENGYSLSKVTAWLTDPSGHVIVEVIEPTIGDIDIIFLEDGSTIGADGEPVEGRTREEFILRELNQQSGEVFNQDELVRDVETLLSLGIFQDASVELQPDDSPENPTVDVIYRLEEGFARSLRVGGGISTELGLFGSVTYQDRNFRGIGEELDLGIQAGGRGLEFNTGFTSPYRDSNPNRLGYSINGFRRSNQSLTFSDEVPLANGDDARERRFGGGVSVMRPLGEWDAELGFDYARVSIRDDDGDIATEDALGNSLTASDSGIDDLLTLGFRITQDRRLNPNNPAGGSVLRLGTEQSIPVGNGSILMNRLTASYAQYVPTDVFGSGSLRNPEVFAFNVQGGTILGELPPYEAFDLGGMNSVRGYAGGDVGSGRSYILASAEYRFPIFSTLGGVLFTDFASDLGTGSSVEGDPAGSRDKPGTGFGYGFGLRFGSPIGLIRADFCFNHQENNQFHFWFGHRF